MASGSRYSLLVLNQNWFVSELRSLGHRVVYASWLDEEADIKLPAPGAHFNELLSLLPADFTPDCVVYFDNSGPAALLGIEDAPFPTIFYSVDAHHHAPWQVHYGSAFDRVLIAQKDFIEEFARCNAESYWFPLWAHEHLESREPKTINVSFRGNLDPKLHPRRATFFDALRLLVEIDTLTAPYDNIYSVSRIVVNQTVKSDLNFRVFEAMGCGAMLLTPDIQNGLHELFTPGVDIVVYKEDDVEDAAAKIRYYLANEEERQRIANSGYQKIREQHRASYRAKQLVEHVSRTRVSARPKKRFGSAVAFLTASTICRKHFDALSDLLLLAAAMSVRASLAEREPVEPEKLCCLGHDCRFRLEKNGLQGKSFEIASLLFERNVDDPLNRLAFIDSLVRTGRAREATALCTVFPDDPQVVMEHARNAMTQLAEQLEAAARKHESG